MGRTSPEHERARSRPDRALENQLGCRLVGMVMLEELGVIHP